jgi:hypothetical protein
MCETVRSACPPADGAVVLDLERDRLLKLNPVGVEIWKLLKAGDSESQIVRTVAEEYRVDPGRVARDVRALLQKLSELGVAPSGAVLSEQASFQPQQTGQVSFPWYGNENSIDRPQPKVISLLFALIGLAAFDFTLSVFSLKSLCACVKAWPRRERDFLDTNVIGQVCAAVEKACVWYPGKALCLQRSAVTTCLLRSHGVAAQMVVGARPMPFLAHAWVEVDGSVVNDWPRVKTFYPSLASY